MTFILAIEMLLLIAACTPITEGTENPVDVEELIDELGGQENNSPVAELVSLICECQIKDACENPEHSSIIDPLHPRSSPRDCYDILKLGQKESGQYDVYPIGIYGAVRVYCDMTTDGGGWTVFQRREEATVDFYRDWEEYKTGFGPVGGSFWLGNENLFFITNQEKYELRIDLEDFDGAKRYAKYDLFRIGDEASSYMLAIGSYTGDAGDGMTERHANSLFSTKDRDNDKSAQDCSEKDKGGWWYGTCYHSNLNGFYLKGAHTSYRGIQWIRWRDKYSLKYTEMKMRPSVANN